MRRGVLIWLALWELFRYDFMTKLRGFCFVHHEVARLRPSLRRRTVDEATISDAAELAMSLYWKPVRCLQRSVATARLLRKCGIDGAVVIGFRPVPFAAHAWVEIGGRAGKEFSGFKQLVVIDRF